MNGSPKITPTSPNWPSCSSKIAYGVGMLVLATVFLIGKGRK